MPRPGPSVTSGADLQPGSDSLFPSGFTGGGARPSAGSVGTGEIADGSVSGADLNLASVTAALNGTYATRKDIRAGGVLPAAPGLNTVPNGATPTVTLSAANAATAITSGVTVYAFDPAQYGGFPAGENVQTGRNPQFTFIGCPVKVNRGAPTGFGAFTYPAYNALTDGSRQKNVTVSFVHDGTDVEILELGYSAKTRITVDGVVVTTGTQGWAATGTTSQIQRRRLAFGSRAHRVITVQCADFPFTGVTIGPTDGLYAARMPRIPRAIALGDSVTAGQNIDVSRLTIWTTYLAGLLGWDIWDAGQGGTGYINPGSFGGFTTFQGRLATDVTPYAPDYVLVAGGLNDQDSGGAQYNSTTRRAAVASFIDACRATLPNAVPILIGGFYTKGTEPLVAAVNADIAFAAAAKGVIYVPTEGLITGSGKVTATTGTGTADVYLSNDGVHPTAAGHEAWARYIASKIPALLTA